MKASKVAQVVSALLATDAKPTEASILAAILAADKKGGKDEGGLGPVEIQKKAANDAELKEHEAEDAAGEYFGHTKDEWEKMDAKDRKGARDKARDEKDDPEHTNDEETDVDANDDVQPKESVTGGGSPAGNKGATPAKDKKGMDAAAVDARVKLAVDARDALHAARREVETVLGVVAYDSAEAVYKAALDKLGVDTTGVHASAYPALFRMKRDAVAAAAPTLGSDAATVKTMAGAIKGYNRLP
jgi:hypothetical protein